MTRRVVSLFQDIGRSEFPHSPRSNLKYIRHFVSGIGQLDCHVTVFTTESTSLELLEAIRASSLRASVDFEITDFSDLPFSSSKDEIEDSLTGSAMRFYSMRDSLFSISQLPKHYFDMVLRRASSRRLDIWSELPITSPSAPEYLHWKYLVVTWAKPWVLRESYLRGLVRSSDEVLFADFGLGHSSKEFSKLISGSSLKPSFLEGRNAALTYRNYIPSFSSPWELASQIDDATIPAGLIAANANGSKLLSEFFDSSIRHYLRQGLVVDDQCLLALFAQKHQDQVRLLPASKRYPFADISHFIEASS